MHGSTTSHRWQNWSGLATACPDHVISPVDAAEVAEAVVAARVNGLRVKMVGSGHSFTDIAVGNGLQLRPDRLVGIRSVDREAMTVTALSGTPLRVLNALLDNLGLALHTMGDIDAQTVAGAISTGAHGTRGRWASLSAQVAGLVRCHRRYDEMVHDNHHVDLYWFPHTRCMVGPPQTWHMPTRGGQTSSGCATRWTPTGCSPTPTSAGSSADDATTPRSPLRGPRSRPRGRLAVRRHAPRDATTFIADRRAAM